MQRRKNRWVDTWFFKIPLGSFQHKMCRPVIEDRHLGGEPASPGPRWPHQNPFSTVCTFRNLRLRLRLPSAYWLFTESVRAGRAWEAHRASSGFPFLELALQSRSLTGANRPSGAFHLTHPLIPMSPLPRPHLSLLSPSPSQKCSSLVSPPLRCHHLMSSIPLPLSL